jgi:putative DNA primase/helicase
MIELAQSESPFPIRVDQLDADPWLLNCSDGTINLRTGELQKHRREDLLTKCCPVSFADGFATESNLWLEFLNRIFAGNGALIQYVQRLLGAALVGQVLEQTLPILWGRGANGKSVLVESFMGILGPDYAMKAPTGFLEKSLSERHPTELADLHGKRFVAAVESGEDARLSEVRVKELTGGDSIRARRMREDFWQFKPSHTLILTTNHVPTIHGVDHGIWRRIHLVPFTVTIPVAEQDKQLAQKLMAEWTAILHWAVQGCLDWQRNGLQPPTVVTDATASYRSEMDTFGSFIKECCETGPNCSAQASQLYDSFKGWAEETGNSWENKTWFGKRLTAEGYQKKKSTGGLIRYHGIQVREAREGEEAIAG